ncbi:hypothetical protein K438DRAFT_689535 [Mycena galopus ATCC 62051]|nr:hypothetical protein K438DRAFT_689535 [Mycena galopus ATCC 62051]
MSGTFDSVSVRLGITQIPSPYTGQPVSILSVVNILNTQRCYIHYTNLPTHI